MHSFETLVGVISLLNRLLFGEKSHLESNEWRWLSHSRFEGCCFVGAKKGWKEINLRWSFRNCLFFGLVPIILLDLVRQNLISRLLET